MHERQFSELLDLPGDNEGPVFREPWEASAFAIAVNLSEAGYFTWSEWVDYLSREIRDAEAAEDHDHVDDGHDYYHHWFSALEKLAVAKKILDKPSLDSRHQYLKDNPVPHDHVARREPVCIA